MITLKQAQSELQARREFNAGNLSARISGGVYEVFSYFTLIAVSTPYEPSDFAELSPVAYNYSPTTSKHVNIVKKAWDI